MRELWDVYDRYGNRIEGRVAVRGKHDLKDHEYHLIVYVWIIGDDGKIILSRRQKGKAFAGAWECTGGCAMKGEDSLTAALREVKEELGLELSPEFGEFYTRYRRNYPKGSQALCDVWVFRQSYSLEDLSPQKEEVSAIRTVTREELEAMADAGVFSKRYLYLPAMLKQFCAPKEPSV
jgi:8-oxo-dGTP pyrophosphatase MutT (NUDIX family)